MDYLTARELTWGSIWWKAKFLHEYALSEEIMNSWIDLKIMNPKKQNLWTTMSSNKDLLSSWVEIVNKRDNITFVKITKASFSEWVGDIDKIFELVRLRWFSIDMIITSETEVSFSLEVKDESTLNEWQTTLKSEFFDNNISEINNVVIKKNMTLMHCIGQNLEKDYQTNLAYALITLTSADIKIHYILWVRTKWAIIFPVDTGNAIKSVKLLSKQFNLVKQ